MKVYVLVETFQLIVAGVYVSFDEPAVKRRFKEYTGVDFEEYKEKLDADPDLTPDHILGDYDQTKIFEFELTAVDSWKVRAQK